MSEFDYRQRVADLEAAIEQWELLDQERVKRIEKLEDCIREITEKCNQYNDDGVVDGFEVVNAYVGCTDLSEMHPVLREVHSDDGRSWGKPHE